MWGLAETQFRNIADDMARDQVAAARERAASTPEGKRTWQPGQRAPDSASSGIQRRTAHRAWAPR
ncbi:hypothetical protein [Actinosynnema sp. ALI-1.44]|uniref:hypothetical protein n=1 Tax=Actinosynnema sp. ALI-1.44 TaxID=1933779 RepID=UPI00143D9976|nr:hypothetical protein [Actinosynnema sp. ALI-1.44]